MTNQAENIFDSALAVIGLQRRRPPTNLILPALGFLGVGLLVGAGTALLLAPKRGTVLRQDIGRALRKGADKLRRSRSQASDGSDSSDIDAGEDFPVDDDLNNSAASL